MQKDISSHRRAVGMRGSIALTALFGLFVCLSLYSVAAQKSASQASVREAIQKRYDRLSAAFIAGDRRQMTDIMTADFQNKAMDGGVTKREQAVNALLSLLKQMRASVPAGAADIQPAYRVKIAGVEEKGAAIVVLAQTLFAESLVDAEGKIGPKGLTHRIEAIANTSDTWVRKGGQWKLQQTKELSKLEATLDGKPLSAPPSASSQSPPAPSSPSSPSSLQAEPISQPLDAVTIVEGYRLQPPAHYTPVPQDVPEDQDDATSYAWGGASRPNGTRPLLFLNLIVGAGDAVPTGTLEQTAQKSLEDVHKKFRDWTQTRPERTTIHGLAFARIAWSGMERKRKARMQGWLYAGVDGDTLIQIAAQDAAPFAAQTLSRMDASARTLTRPRSRIYFSAQWPDHAQIFAMNPDGSERVCLTPLSDSDYHPALSPDGATIAFSTHRDHTRALYLMNADGTQPRLLSADGDAGLCAWSPDGTRLAFSSNRAGRYCIYVINRDGSQLRRLTNGPSEDCPSWSADGKRIAYEGREGANWRIWVVNADGTGAKPITAGRWSDRWPQWSPIGDALVYTSYEHGNGDICLMLSDGAGITRLTTNAAEDRQPSWTADGRQLLFHSNRAGRFDIYALDLDTLAEHRLSVEPKDTAEAVTWGRRYTGATGP